MKKAGHESPLCSVRELAGERLLGTQIDSPQKVYRMVPHLPPQVVCRIGGRIFFKRGPLLDFLGADSKA